MIATTTALREGRTLTRAGRGLYRILDDRNRIAGHVQVVRHELGVRYRAKRYSPRRAGFIELGEFWSLDDAITCALSR